MGEVQIYCAVSLDGFIAGPDDDLSWLEDPNSTPDADPGTIGFSDFMEQTGAMLMGRRTYDVIKGMGGDWPYGTTPVLVATTRALPHVPETVSACRGEIGDLCRQAIKVAGDKNVYLDGGNMISQALDAGCVDSLVLTVVPVLLGSGIPLYSGKMRHRFTTEILGRLGDMTQLRMSCQRA